MTALLYYSYSRNLTEDEIVKIDEQVTKNREGVCLFVRKLPSNPKRKTKRVIILFCLGFVLVFSNIELCWGIGMSLPPLQIEHKIIVSDQDANKLIKPSKVKINSDIEPKIIMPSLSKNVKNPGELSLPTYIYLMDDKFLRRPEISSIIRELRGGS